MAIHIRRLTSAHVNLEANSGLKNMSSILKKIVALILLVIAGAIGGVSYLSFLLFLYSGAPDWIGLNLSESGNLMFNGGLCLAFFLQHSGMIRRSVRKRLARYVPSHYQGAIYTLASGVVLLACVAFWQRSETILWQADGPMQYLFRLPLFLSILGMVWGIHAIGSIDMFGLDPILKHIRTTPAQEIPFTVRGPYRWVRHPLYLFMIVLFWSCPILTTDRLLFNLAWTIWVVGATLLEERDLTDAFGDAYRDYQARVPMLLPRRSGPFYPNR